jgi:hypothetical protein
VDEVHYYMSSLDGGLKYKGMSLEAEYYWRTLNGFKGTGVAGLPQINDHGYQIQASAMVVPEQVQLYAGNSGIRGHYGNANDYRLGINWYPLHKRGVRINAEWLDLDKSPVGYTAVPYPVGGNGTVFHVNAEMNF